MRRISKLIRGLMVVLLLVAGVFSVRIGLADDGDRAETIDTNEMGGSGSSDEVETAGTVIGMNTLVKPPIVKIVNIDGEVILRIRKPDELIRNGVRIGDDISIIGQKVTAFEFNVDIIRVDERGPATPSNDLTSGGGNGNGSNGNNGNSGNGNSGGNGNNSNDNNSNNNGNSNSNSNDNN